jgi:hypothetical protein
MNHEEVEPSEDNGFAGTITENGHQHPLNLRLKFGDGSKLEGSGQDPSGEFLVLGTFTDNEVSFVAKYVSGVILEKQFSGSRHVDTSIQGIPLGIKAIETIDFLLLHFLIMSRR